MMVRRRAGRSLTLRVEHLQRHSTRRVKLRKTRLGESSYGRLDSESQATAPARRLFLLPAKILGEEPQPGYLTVRAKDERDRLVSQAILGLRREGIVMEMLQRFLPTT